MPNKEKIKARQVIDALKKAKGFKSAAARALGVAPSTIANYVNKYPSIKKALDEIDASTLDFVEGKLLQKINTDDLGAIIFFLKCRGKSRGYIERQGLELSNPDGTALGSGPVSVEVNFHKPTAEELAELTG